jgi:superfamily II DNA helicase RecQ
LQRTHHVLNIAATGSGKTLPYELAVKHWGGSIVTVYCCPYVVLYNEFLNRFSNSGIDCRVYEKGIDLAGCSSIITSVNGFPNALFNQLMNAANMGRLAIIVVDEAHTLIDDLSFRSTLAAFAKQISSIPNALLCLQSATVPPAFESELWKVLGLQPVLGRVLRTPSTQRYNISYQALVLNLAPLTDNSTSRDRFTFLRWIERVLPVIREYEEEIMEPEERGLIFFGSDVQTERWAKILGCPAIVGKIKQAERKAAWAGWKAGTHRFLCVNKAGYFGVDYPSVTITMFIDMPWSLLDHMQSSGRGARGDGEESNAVVVLGRKPKKPSPADFKNEDFSGKIGIKKMLCLDECLRISPSTHFDGQATTCSEIFAELGKVAWCTWCWDHVEGAIDVETLSVGGDDHLVEKHLGTRLHCE